MIQKCKCTSRFKRGAVSIGIIALCLKLLVMRAEFSTDMDVHAHWKALVYTVPLGQWYTDTSSEWTLDYPPLFAYFEYALSRIAAFVRPEVLVVNQKVSSDVVKYFLRLSVIGTDPLLILCTMFLIQALREQTTKNECCNHLDSDLHAAALVFLSPALMLVDNVHFQYNGLPLSALLLSIGLLVQERCVAGVISFACAINLKHTLLPLAPALAVTTLSCLIRRSKQRNQSALQTMLTKPFLLNAALVLGSFFLAFAMPWIPLWFISGRDGLYAILARLFPFKRGLLHAYWAANFWAIYAAADLILCAAGFVVRNQSDRTTSGIIGATSPFGLLPNINPKICAGTILALLLPVLVFAMYRGINSRLESARDSPKLAAYSALVAFVFGWHVHEKNVLVALLPLAASMGVERDESMWMSFILLAIGGQFGVFPLITGSRIAPLKISHFAVYAFYLLCLGFRWVRSSWRRALLVAYVAGVFAVEMYSGVGGGHSRLFGDRLEFLPLMLVSLYSSIGVLSALLGLVVYTTAKPITFATSRH